MEVLGLLFIVAVLGGLFWFVYSRYANLKPTVFVPNEEIKFSLLSKKKKEKINV